MEAKRPTDYRQYDEDNMGGRVDKEFWSITKNTNKDEKQKKFKLDVGRTSDDECFTVA